MSSRPIIIFDGECGLCNKAVARLIRADKHAVFGFIGSDSDVGHTLLKRAGQPESITKDSVVLVDGDQSWVRSAAVLRIFSLLGLPWNVFSWARIVPASLRDGIYSFIAKHRKKVKGADAACGLPPAHLRDLWMQRIVTAEQLEAPARLDEFEFEFSATFRPLLQLLGITPAKSYVRITDERFVARFGQSWVDTEITNVRCVQQTGPYRWWKAIGMRGSMADSGVTFGSATTGGVCICFHNKVAGMTRLKEHSGLTVTVQDPNGLEAAIRARIPEAK